jgi:hypothetical protein
MDGRPGEGGALPQDPERAECSLAEAAEELDATGPRAAWRSDSGGIDHRATSLSTYSDEFRLCTTDQFCIGIVYCCGWWSSFSFAGAGTSSRRTPTTTPWKLTVSVAELSRWTPCWRSQQLRPGCASASGIKTRLLARRLQPRGATTTNLRRARSGLACWV